MLRSQVLYPSFHTVWVIRDRVEPAAGKAMSVIPLKAEVIQSISGPATGRAGLIIRAGA